MTDKTSAVANMSASDLASMSVAYADSVSTADVVDLCHRLASLSSLHCEVRAERDAALGLLNDANAQAGPDPFKPDGDSPRPEQMAYLLGQCAVKMVQAQRVLDEGAAILVSDIHNLLGAKGDS